MNKIVWKYQILPEIMDVKMPKGAEVLTIQCQNNVPTIWALVNPNAEKEYRRFELFGTGHDIPCDNEIKRKYINTFQMENRLVFHLFERTD